MSLFAFEILTQLGTDVPLNGLYTLAQPDPVVVSAVAKPQIATVPLEALRTGFPDVVVTPVLGSTVSWSYCSIKRAADEVVTLPTTTGIWERILSAPGREYVIELTIPPALVSPNAVSFSWDTRFFEQKTRWITISRSPCAVPINPFGVVVTPNMKAWNLARGPVGTTYIKIENQEGSLPNGDPILAPGRWFLTLRSLPGSAVPPGQNENDFVCTDCGLVFSFTGLRIS